MMCETETETKTGKYDTLLCDLDGTLLDTIADLTDAVNHALRTLGFPERTETEAKHFLGNGAKMLVVRSLPEGTGEETAEQAVTLFKAYYQKHNQDKTAPYPGVMEVLRELRDAGWRLAVISNKFDAAVKQLNETYFGGVIDIAIGENEAAGRRKKPNPDAVLDAMRLLGSDPGSCLYIGDSEVDILTAKNAGLPCISCTWGFRTREELLACGADPTYMIDRPEDLPAFLNRLNG